MDSHRSRGFKSAKIGVTVAEFLEMGHTKLQFKIKDQDYFLAFVEQEKRWYVFAPTSEGVNRIPVYVDAVKYQKPGILETETRLSS